MNDLQRFLSDLASFLWGPPLVTLLAGGGIFFLLYSRLLPYRYLPQSIKLLARRADDNEPGQLSHFQALSTALSGTLGMGNVAGVAIAIAMGGPGAIFWMWMSALLGIATKFYTCSLAVMFRGKDSLGEWQGGPMYVVREGLGPRWRPLAYFFALAGLFGTMPVFQVNQLVQVLRDTIAVPAGLPSEAYFLFELTLGLLLALVVIVVALGQLPRLARVTAVMVPLMVAGYLLLTFAVLIMHLEAVPAAFRLIISDAFSGEAA
ncbi:alanine:cation symporter family protein, partial [Litorivivens sp.]